MVLSRRPRLAFASLAFASGVDPVKGFRGGVWVMKLIKEDQPQIGYYDDEPLAKK